MAYTKSWDVHRKERVSLISAKKRFMVFGISEGEESAG